jgi:hypothetical protein
MCVDENAYQQEWILPLFLSVLPVDIASFPVCASIYTEELAEIIN